MTNIETYITVIQVNVNDAKSVSIQTQPYPEDN